MKTARGNHSELTEALSKSPQAGDFFAEISDFVGARSYRRSGEGVNGFFRTRNPEGGMRKTEGSPRRSATRRTKNGLRAVRRERIDRGWRRMNANRRV